MLLSTRHHVGAAERDMSAEFPDGIRSDTTMVASPIRLVLLTLSHRQT